MKTTNEQLSAEDFVERLQSEESMAPLAFYGMAKKADDSEHIMFSLGTACSSWIEVPISRIEQIELLNTVACRDHTHPYVKMHLSRPESADALLFSALAQQAVSRAITSPQNLSSRPLTTSPGTVISYGGPNSPFNLICDKLEYVGMEGDTSVYDEKAYGCIWIYLLDYSGNIQTGQEHICSPPNKLKVPGPHSFGCDC
jgi:hypothetical protein